MRTFAIALVFLAASTVIAEQPVRGKRQPGVTALSLTPDGKGHVQGSQAGLVVHNGNGSNQTLPTKLDHIHALAFSPDGARLAAAGGSPAELGIVEVWSWPGGKLLHTLKGQSDLVYDVAWLPDSKSLASASGDKTIRIWEVASAKTTKTLTGHSGPVLALAISPGGKLLCSGGIDQTIRVWDVGAGKLLRALTNHLGPVQDLAFRPPQPGIRHYYLASAGSDATVRIWQPAIGRLVRFIRHPAPVFTVAWNRKGDRVLSGAKDGFVRWIDGDSDQIMKQKKIEKGWPISLVTRGQGKMLAGATSGQVAR